MYRGCLEGSDLQKGGSASPRWTSPWSGGQGNTLTHLILYSSSVSLGLTTGCIQGGKEEGRARISMESVFTGRMEDTAPQNWAGTRHLCLEHQTAQLLPCGSWFSLTTGQAGPHPLVGLRLRVTSMLDDFTVYANSLKCSCQPW